MQNEPKQGRRITGNVIWEQPDLLQGFVRTHVPEDGERDAKISCNTASHNMERFPDPPRNCDLCPRLHGFLQEWRRQEPDWYNAPVKPFLPQGGRDSIRLLLVGLAPGLHGANRTGRPFTGDKCGALLYSTLRKYGFAKGEYKERVDDGLQLVNMAIVNAVRCVPPENKPLGAEINACRRFLTPYFYDLPKAQVIVTLGKVAHETTLRALGVPVKAVPFIHGRMVQVGKFQLISSYHCSHYDTSTGRLTEAMFHDIFAQARDYLDSCQ